MSQHEMKAFEDFISLQDFYTELERHDWFHYMSDDSTMDRRGEENRKRINKLAADDPVKEKLLADYHAHMTGIVRQVPVPKPGRPE